MAKKPISARIDEAIIENAKKVAEKELRSFNNLIEIALQEYCKGKL